MSYYGSFCTHFCHCTHALQELLKSLDTAVLLNCNAVMRQKHKLWTWTKQRQQMWPLLPWWFYGWEPSWTKHTDLFPELRNEQIVAYWKTKIGKQKQTSKQDKIPSRIQTFFSELSVTRRAAMGTQWNNLARRQRILTHSLQ